MTAHRAALPVTTEVSGVTRVGFRTAAPQGVRPVSHLLPSQPQASPPPAGAARCRPQPTATCLLGPRPESVKTGRGFTRATLAEWDMPALTDAAELVVSELVTNALRHGIPSACQLVSEHCVRLRLLAQAPFVMCMVTDPGHGIPVLRDSDPAAESGRGLTVVEVIPAQNLLLVLGEYIWEQQVIPPPEQWKTGVHNVRELGKYAADLGLQIALELEPFKLSLVNDVDSMVRFLDDVNHPAVQANIDISHLQLSKVPPEELRRLLSAPAPDPPLGVDADLRPEGRQGPLVRSLAAYRQYYERWSHVWEAQALLRARYVAGDTALAGRFLELADGVRYPAGGLTPEQVTEIRRIKARVDSERLPRGADPALHAKLGRGGLADIEWTVQLLQLRYGYEQSELHTTGTLSALEAARRAELVDGADALSLSRAWILASRVRNALMLVRGRPADELPRHGPELAGVVRILHAPEAGAFVDDYLRTARRARQVFERLFGL